MPGAPAILAASTLNTFQPLCYSKVASGELLMVNGLQRGYRWDGLTNLLETLGMTAPGNTPTVSTPTGGNATAGDYLCAFRFIDDDLPNPVPSDLSPTATVTAAASDKFSWTITTTDSDTRAVKVQLWRSTAEALTVLWYITELGIRGTATTASDSGGFTRWTLYGLTGSPDPHNLAIGAKFLMAGNSTGAYNTTHTVTAVSGVLVTTDVAYVNSGGGSPTWTLSGYTEDTASDNTISASSNTSLPLLNSDGSVNANRFGLPPNFKAVCAQFQDRMFYGVDVVYNSGTAGVTSGNTSVSASGGAVWNTAFAGRYFYVTSENRPYKITAATSSTLTLAENFRGSTATVSYAIRPGPDERNQLYFSAPSEPEAVLATNTIKVQENTGDEDDVVGLLPTGGSMLVLKDRHIYRLNFVRQPTIDVSVNLAAHRGAVNHRTAISVEGIAWLMDREGIYTFDSAGVHPIEAIQDLFRDGLIDFSVSKWFFCTKDVQTRTVRFHVRLTSQSDTTYPQSAICINYRTGACWIETTPFVLASGCSVVLGEQPRTLVGSGNEQLYLQGEGIRDGTATDRAIDTVASATSSSVTTSTGSFPADCTNGAIAVVSGTGKGQVRRITGTSGSTITVEPNWTTTPDSTSTVHVGGIAWSGKTGLMRLARRTDNQTPRNAHITYLPTTNAATMDVRTYINHEGSPRNMSVSDQVKAGLTTTVGLPDVVVDMKSARSALGTNSGLANVPMSGGHEAGASPDKNWMALELRGVQTRDAIEIYELLMEGVE